MAEDFKSTLWKTADSLRAQMDAAEYKHIVLGLIFLKYMSDSFAEQRKKVEIEISDPKSDIFFSDDPADIEEALEDQECYKKDNVFWVSKAARWETLRSQAKQ